LAASYEFSAISDESLQGL